MHPISSSGFSKNYLAKIFSKSLGSGSFITFLTMSLLLDLDPDLGDPHQSDFCSSRSKSKTVPHTDPSHIWS